MDEYKNQEKYSPLDNSLIDAMKAEIEINGFKQKDIEEITGISQATLSRLLNAKTKKLDDETRQKLIKWLRPLDFKLFEYFTLLRKEDKITVLRFIFRLANDPEKADQEFTSLLKEIIP